MCVEHVGRVLPAQQRVEEDPVGQAVDDPGGLAVGRVLSGRPGDDRHGLSVMLTVRAPAARSARAARPWPSSRWCTAAKAAAGSCRPGRVHARWRSRGTPSTTARSAWSRCRPGRRAGRTRSRRTRRSASAVSRLVQPPAVLQGLRQVPVVERDHRVDALAEQFVGQPVVEVQAAGLTGPVPSGWIARPGDREAVGRAGRGRAISATSST